MSKTCQWCIEIRIRLWKYLWQTWLCSTVSLSYGVGKCLQYVQETLNKGLESTNFLESDCKLENSFWVFSLFLNVAYDVLAAIFRVRVQGFIQHMYVMRIRSRISPKVHGIMTGIYDWQSNLFSIFSFMEPCQSWIFLPCWLRKELPSCPSYICCTKRSKKHIFWIFL